MASCTDAVLLMEHVKATNKSGRFPLKEIARAGRRRNGETHGHSLLNSSFFVTRLRSLLLILSRGLAHLTSSSCPHSSPRQLASTETETQ